LYVIFVYVAKRVVHIATKKIVAIAKVAEHSTYREKNKK
jgi:hypothetical protein